MKLARSCHWGLLAMLTLSAPAAAFDDLLSAVGAFPGGIDTPYIFDYSAPKDGFAAYRGGLADNQLAQALVSASGVDPVTGIAFGEVTGVLTIGDPPKTLTMLFAEPGFADGAPETLASRGFEETVVDDLPVFARGEDYAVDLTTARDPDPFASGMGKAQRLAFGTDYMLRTAGWPEMRSALAALPHPSPDKQIWTAMINGLRAASGEGAHLDVASGWAVSAFFDPGPGMDLMLDPEGAKAKFEAAASEPGEAIVFPYVLFAATQGPVQASTHIVLPFGGEAQARAAGEEVAERLAAYSPGAAAPRVTVDDDGTFFVAVVSMDVAAAEAPQALDLFNRWIGGVYQRDFKPLMLP
ncbi:hypothetical protein [Devosia lacusdianchii]|uniref:hypothetical protein n=1 Tax=Devosia lacusdianchii TaxID=2917991 RepID=UPI001F05E4CA|nr:hypothetical protein [Devosia sp. JXJ CY 41]